MKKVFGAVFSATLVFSAGFLPVSEAHADPTGCKVDVPLANKKRALYASCTSSEVQYRLKMTCVRLAKGDKPVTQYGSWVKAPLASMATCPTLYRPKNGSIEFKDGILMR